MRRRPEMLDVGNNLGNGKKCKCGAKQERDHLIIRYGRKIRKGKVKWLGETENIEIARRMNKWMEKYIKIGEENYRE